MAIVLFLLCAFLGATEALAGGYAIPPQTAKAASLANAQTAGVDDPSAVYVNPAALAEVDGNQVIGGLNYIAVLGSVTNSGTQSRNQHDDNSIPTLFANYHLPGTSLTLGLGLYTPFGLATSYDKTSFTRFAAVRSELKTLYLTPSIAWRPHPALSMGGGVSFVHSSALFSRAVNLGPLGEGYLRLTDTDNGFAYNLGILIKPRQDLKFGLTYRSRVQLDYDTADVKFNVGAVTSAKSSGTVVPLPALISLGINWQINPAWDVNFVYDFTRWSTLEHFKARFTPALLGGALSGFFIPQDWKDTSTLRLGTSYRIRENLELRAGIAVDETPIPSRTLGPAIPGADWLTLTGGIGYRYRAVTVDLGYMAVFYKTRRVTNNVLETGGDPSAIPLPDSGKDKYENFNHLLLLSFGYRF